MEAGEIVTICFSVVIGGAILSLIVKTIMDRINKKRIIKGIKKKEDDKEHK